MDCKLNFKTPREFSEHIQSQAHKERAQNPMAMKVCQVFLTFWNFKSSVKFKQVLILDVFLPHFLLKFPISKFDQKFYEKPLECFDKRYCSKSLNSI